MSTFQKMKENMIAGQFLPGLIKDEKLLKVFNEIDREKYLPNELKHLAYSESNIKVASDRYLVSPFFLAKIIEKSSIKTQDVVLLVGSNYGYESAIISKISSAVMALEEDINFHKQADINIKTNLIDNVVNINGSFLKGSEKFSPYDVIILLGSGKKPSEELLHQLANNGKLMICENYNANLDESKLFMYTKTNKNIIKEFICDLNIPKLIFDEEHRNTFSLEN